MEAVNKLLTDSQFLSTNFQVLRLWIKLFSDKNINEPSIGFLYVDGYLWLLSQDVCCSHAMSTVTDQDIDNNNCIQEYRQFHVDISAVCTWIHPHYAYSRQWIAYLIKQILFFSWPQPCHDVWTHNHLVTILICPTK